MIQIKFNQTAYLGQYPDGTKVKICPRCSETFSPTKDDCPKCGLYLPSFPTSWLRSATNFFLLRRIMEIVSIDMGGKFDKNTLTDILIDYNVITVDAKRINDPIYYRGGPIRRSEEYKTNLLYLGFIKKDSSGYVLSNSGLELIRAKTYDSYLAVLTKAFMELKIGNEYDERGTYRQYDNRIFLSSLRIIKDLNEKGIEAYSQHVALAVMSKNEETEYKKALNVSVEFDIDKIDTMWFGEGREFGRVINGVVIRWLKEARLIDILRHKNKNRLSLTKYGKQVLEEYSKPIVKGEMLGSMEKIMELMHSSIYRQYLRLNLGSEKNNRSGASWESIVKSHFENLDFNIRWYRETQDFVRIDLPDYVTASLTGGTRHNPDLIIKNPLWLIDPKKDVNAEMHKVLAYDTYAGIVNGTCIIVSQKPMKDKKVEIMSGQKLDNVIVLDGFALQIISDNKNYFSPETVERIIGKTREDRYYYLDEALLFDKFIQ